MLPSATGSQEAVADVDLRLNAGETVAMVGHNGAGKTTVMKLMLGLIRPSAGTVQVLGGDPRPRPGAAAWASCPRTSPSPRR